MNSFTMPVPAMTRNAATANPGQALPLPEAVTPDDSNDSVAGEDDPGAALDTLAPCDAGSGRRCAVGSMPGGGEPSILPNPTWQTRHATRP